MRLFPHKRRIRTYGWSLELYGDSGCICDHACTSIYVCLCAANGPINDDNVKVGVSVVTITMETRKAVRDTYASSTFYSVFIDRSDAGDIGTMT